MIDAGLANPSQKFEADENYEQIRDWFADMRPIQMEEFEPPTLGNRIAAMLGDNDAKAYLQEYDRFRFAKQYEARM